MKSKTWFRTQYFRPVLDNFVSNKAKPTTYNMQYDNADFQNKPE